MKKLYKLEIESTHDGGYVYGYYSNKKTALRVGRAAMAHEEAICTKWYGANWRKEVREPCFHLQVIKLNPPERTWWK